MDLQVNTKIKILRPVHDVFEAIVDPEKMSGYFISAGSGRLEEEKAITWTWAWGDYEIAEFQIKVTRVETDRLVSFLWKASGSQTIVEINLEPPDEASTLVRIRENGWEKTDKGIAALAEHSQVWARFLACLKAYLEYGINLRKGAI